MNNVSMRFGRPAKTAETVSGMIQIETGYLSGESGDSTVFSVTQHQIYLLFTREITISSGAIRGYRAIQIARTETDSFSRQNLAASTNSGVTITNDTTNGTITLAPSSTSYDVYYALYAVL